MNILIAEDDELSRAILKRSLRKEGYPVVEAVDGKQALDLLLGASAPELAILDWMMPNMEGLEVVRAVRARETDVPAYVIMLTGRDHKEDVVTGLAAGANDYLTKPFDSGELHARVAVGVRMIELQQKLARNVRELHAAIEQIKTLRGIVPICSYCKKIRDDTGYWQQVEQYVHEHTEAEFSHGICPECMKKMMPEE